MQIARDYGIVVEKGSRGGGGAAPKKPIVTLSRDDALAKVLERAASIELPLKLSHGITVTNIGSVRSEYVTETSLPLIGYTAEWVDENGVKFISKVVDTGNGPYYSVHAVLDATEGESSAEPVEVGAGLTPVAAWQAAGERQHDVMELAALHKQEGSSHDEEMEPGDSLLLRAASLAGQWGLQRFGFADVKCLQALEGQPGVASTRYKFIEERSSWEAEAGRLQREASHHALADGMAPSRPRASRRPKSQAERDKVAVTRVIEGMVRQLEAMEARDTAAEQKAMAKKEKEAQRLLEKERRRLAKEREKEISKQLQEQQREMVRAAAAEAARLAAEAARTYPDETIAETATLPPPAPSALATGRLPPSCEPVLVEAWHLLNRFPDLINIQRSDIPILAQLEGSLVEGPNSSSGASHSRDPAIWVASTLVDFLITALFTKTAANIAEASADVTEKDICAKPPHPVPIGPDTWQEAARRYLAIVADTAACEAKLGENGLPYPSEHFEDFLIVQYLLAGPPTALARGWGALPKGSSTHAWLGAVATDDAAALAAAGPIEGPTPRSAPEVDESIRLQRCILRQLATVKGERGRHGRVLCFQGHGAGAATKIGRSLDLRYVGARVDAGVYAAAADPLVAFAADVAFVVELHQAAAAKGKRLSGFYDANKDKGVEEVGAMVMTKLETALEEVARVGGAAYLAEHAPPILQQQEEAAAANANAAMTEGEVKPEEEGVAVKSEVTSGSDDEIDDLPDSDAVHDLKRPFAPWDGCAVCWDDEDDERLLLCSKCGAPYHTYCLDPPLDDVPEGEWLCPGCAPTPATAPKPKFPLGSGGEKIWEMAQLLGSVEYSQWDVSQRAALLSMLCMLVADSPPLRDRLVGEENAQKDMRKELHAKRTELKQKQQEEAADKRPQPAAEGDNGAATAAEPAAAAAAESAEPRMTSRRTRDAVSEIETLVQRISQLEHDVDKFEPQRLDPLGMDRHYNRYWFLPAAALGGDPLGPGAVLIERYLGDPMVGKEIHNKKPLEQSPAEGEWQVGVYKGVESLNTLISWLNTRGLREKALHGELKTVRTRVQVQIQEMLRQQEGGKGSTAEKERQAGAGVAPMETDEAQGVKQNELAGPTTSLERLRVALLDLEANLVPNSRHHLFGRPDAMEAWRARMSSASTPQDLMRGLVCLEQSINPNYLKTQWRPWSMSAPHPDSAGTLAAVWLRLEALRSAISMKIKILKTSGAGLGGRYPHRAKRNADSGVDSEVEGSGADEARGGKSGRSGKRARTTRGEGSDADIDMDDEELARKLHAELNAGRPSRLRHGSTAGEEKRPARAKASLREVGYKSYKEPSDGDDAFMDEEEEHGKGDEGKDRPQSSEDYAPEAEEGQAAGGDV